MSPAALDLAERLLAYDPIRRLSALQAIETPYFTQEAPAAEQPKGYVQLHSLIQAIDFLQTYSTRGRVA